MPSPDVLEYAWKDGLQAEQKVLTITFQGCNINDTRITSYLFIPEIGGGSHPECEAGDVDSSIGEEEENSCNGSNYIQLVHEEEKLSNEEEGDIG